MTPIILVTGYLGAGKTTVISHLLTLPEIASRKLALIINEFGDLGVDGNLVPPGLYSKFELNRGSLFCVCIRTDLIKTLQRIAAEVKPDLVLAEATGIAETGDVEDLLETNPFKGLFAVQGNLCVVDAQNFVKIAAFLKAARSQVASADGLVINKTDAVDASDLETLRAVLKSMNPSAPQIAVSHGKIPHEFIGGLEHKRHSKGPLTTPPDSIVALSFTKEAAVDKKEFLGVLKELEGKVLRLKGHVDFGASHPVFVEVISSRYFERAATYPTKERTAFSVIAWDIPRESLKLAFQRLW